ncbi:MAG: hypothetical protein R3B13_00670 [Polyangiaceae bacterium]
MKLRLHRLVPFLVLLLGCSKQAPEGAAAKSGAARDEAQQVPASPEAPAPPAAAEPTPTSGGEMGPSGEDSIKKRPLKGRESELSTLPEAEAALDEAAKRLEKLLGGMKAEALATGDKRCDEACLAFASLRRAADAICRLAGDSDARCSRAKKIVDDNESKVKACTCES